MITMEGREDDALVTAEGLAEADISTEIFVQPHDWPVGGEGNNRNSSRAINWAIDHVDGPGVLFVEDDIIVKPDGMKRALREAADLNELVYMYMHDIAPRTDWHPDEPIIREMRHQAQYRPSGFDAWQRDKVFPEGVRLMKKDARMFGSQCVYIPKPFLRFLHSYMTFGMEYTAKIRSMPNMAMDTALNNWTASNHLPRYIYLPHPVQHTQNRKRRNGGVREVYSRSFGMMSDKGV